MAFDILPRTFEKMDLLILSGNDVDRLHSFLKINQPLLIQTPKIVLSNALAPSKRAELLKLGYDDVVNMKNSTPADFCARALSCLRRYQITKNSSGDELFINSISNVCNFSKLTSSQRRVIHALIESLGNFSSYGHLCSVASKTNVRVSNEHLRVLIHEIRPALKSGYTINSVYGEGYRLSKET